ncbi:MAG TPA: class I SAM-dependent methyltransferase [Candidatus Nanoarchaeia archaeon]|nr:class I SAM-dependent methyltransferase [Candidatus Nanoarchaeia archaeon]
MKELVFNKIKSEYDDFYKSLMKKGRLPMWSTEKGFWNASIADEVFESFKKVKLSKFRNFLDIGSGDGKIVLIASLFCKNAEGIEIDDVLHHKALEIQSKLKVNNAVFHNKDFFEHDFSKYDVLFTAPDSPFERGLENKLLKEMNGKLIHYGHHFHPANLKKEDNFMVNGTPVSLYSK